MTNAPSAQRTPADGGEAVFAIDEALRQPWSRSTRVVPRLVMRPLERFLRQEVGSAALLMAAAIVALVWANVSHGSYERVWSTAVSVNIGSWRLALDLRGVVNELLMALFFFVVTLEIKREMLFGALRDRRSAIVPVAAALGTMVGGALVYLALNAPEGGDLRGWAVPIAADIAFVLGALGLARRWAPTGSRPFLLTLAVADDLATIMVIALFFSHGLSLAWLAAAVVVAGIVVVAQRNAVRSVLPYVALAALLWLAVFESGIHATIAGVVLGFLTPAVAFHSGRTTSRLLGDRLSEIASSDRDISEEALLQASHVAHDAVSPLARMERRLHPWSAYVVLPIFALANAGVPISLASIGHALGSQIGLGVVLGLVIGAPLGGFLFAWAVVRSRAGRMPEGLDISGIAAITPLKGIGFTIAIFISVLAFDEPALQDEVKLAILLGSSVAALIGILGMYARKLTASARHPG